METFAYCSSSNKGKYHHSTLFFVPDLALLFPSELWMCVCVSSNLLDAADLLFTH